MNKTDWQDALKAMLPTDYQPEETTTEQNEAPAKKPRLDVFVDRKRKGKTAVIISGFDPDDPAVEEVAAMLKRKLACGGSCRDGEILIQGDRVGDVVASLAKAGYKTRKI